MTTRIRIPLLLLAAATFTILVVARLAVASSAFAAKPELVALAVTIDVTLLIPALFYYLGVRRARLPLMLLPAVLLGAITVATVIIPPGYHTYINYAHYLLVPMELTAVAWVVLAVRRGLRALASRQHADMLVSLHAAAGDAVGNGRFAALLAGELAVLYYAVVSWWGRRAAAHGGAAFSYHKRSAYGAMVGVMIMAVIVETVALHTVLASVHVVLAWALAAANAYTCLVLVADYRAAVLRPFEITGNVLRVRVGLRWTLEVPVAMITGARRVRRNETVGGDRAYLRATLMGTPGLVLELAEPARADGILGMRRHVTRVGLAPDDAEGFMRALVAAGMPPTVVRDGAGATVTHG